MPRFYCPLPLAAGAQVTLPPQAARHVQVLRLVDELEGTQAAMGYAFGRV